MKKRKWITYKDGKFYFSRESERKIFFVLTILMLGLGLLFKFGII